MSLYQKYRPQTFAEVAGQDHIVTSFNNAITQNKLVHAYLFTGTRGTGKTSSARILAKTLMTQGIEDAVIKKQIIQGIEDGSLVDLIEIDGASNRNIDDIRELKEKIQFSPVVASAKVYIIDEVHMFTTPAFNALLKTLEEPPSYAYFILATTELHKIPATIQSRCQIYPFRRINTQDIVKQLQYIADAEKITIDQESLQAIAAYAQGGMRDAISLLDQLQSLPQITIIDVQARTGAAGYEQVEAMWQAIQAQDATAIVAQIKQIEQEGSPLEAFVRQLLTRGRAELHANIAAGADVANVTSSIRALLEAIEHMRNQPIPGLALEAALLHLVQASVNQPAAKAVSPAKVVAPAAPVVKANKEPEVTNVPEPTKKEEATPAKMPEATPTKEPVVAKETKVKANASDLTLTQIQSVWLDVLPTIEPASARMSLHDATIGKVSGNTVELHFNSSFHMQKAEAGSHALEKALQKTLEQEVKVKCMIQSGPAVTTMVSDDMVNIADAAADIF